MRIKSIACTQFAGLRDRKRELGGGVDAAFGEGAAPGGPLVRFIDGVYRDGGFTRRSHKGGRVT